MWETQTKVLIVPDKLDLNYIWAVFVDADIHSYFKVVDGAQLITVIYEPQHEKVFNSIVKNWKLIEVKK